MKKKKGLSLEEKRQIMLGIFKNLEFYHYKDIEKYSVKNKISFMIVKDILAGLVGDNLVETEKIGSSSYYWSLPTRVFQVKTNTSKLLDEQIEGLKREIENVEGKIKESKEQRQDTEDRKRNLEEYDRLTKEIEKCMKVIKGFEKNDPERYEKINKQYKGLIDLNEHWSDNIYTIDQWLRSKSPDAKIEEMFQELKELHLFD